MVSYGPSNDRVRMYYKGDYLATLAPERGLIRWKVTSFVASTAEDAEQTGLATTQPLAWECATTAVKEMHAREAA